MRGAPTRRSRAITCRRKHSQEWGCSGQQDDPDGNTFRMKTIKARDTLEFGQRFDP